jgi:hypothetical protein
MNPDASGYDLWADEWTSGKVLMRFAQRASPFHPGPLRSAFAARQSAAPARRRRGEGESCAAFQQNPARCLPHEPPAQPNLPPTVPSPRGRGSG